MKRKVKDKIFQLYGKVQKGDKKAIEEFICLYEQKFPDIRNDYEFLTNRPKAFHTMYLHLTHSGWGK